MAVAAIFEISLQTAKARAREARRKSADGSGVIGSQNCPRSASKIRSGFRMIKIAARLALIRAGDQSHAWV